jgi:beta-lactamase superfamily II metal-dependent hydrolase
MPNSPESKNSGADAPQLSVNVRMYCHGLGDCFLLTFEKGGQKFNMLIDCGVLQGTRIEADPQRAEVPAEGVKESQIMNVVAENIKTTTGGHLNLVVVTHEHHDHICGFKHAKSVFDQMTFDEVWLSWTEDPKNEIAVQLQEKHELRFQNLKKALTALRLLDRKSQETVNSFLAGFSGDALGAAPGKRAAAWLYIIDEIGRKSQPNPPKYTYCYPGREPLKLKGFENDVRVYVLGPPDNLQKLRDLSAPPTDRYRHFAGLLMDSISSAEDNFFLAVDEDSSEANSGLPFKHDLGIVENDAQAEVRGGFFHDSYYGPDAGAWRAIDSDWLAVAGEIALKMDSYTNNTSLVLAIELIKSGKVLLFVGDAQFGNWKSWHDYKWKITEHKTEKTVKTEDLLRRTVVYKVGHHGSHNATLKERGLEMMTNIEELVALIPVDEQVASGKRPHKWEMPFTPLLKDLQRRTAGRVIASDKVLPENVSLPTCKIDEENLFFGSRLFIDYTIYEENG